MLLVLNPKSLTSVLHASCTGIAPTARPGQDRVISIASVFTVTYLLSVFVLHAA